MVEKPVVIKFGGTSVRYAFEEALELVAKLHENMKIIVVVSALAGVTDCLLRLAKGDKSALLEIDEIHEELSQELNVQLEHLIHQLKKTINSKSSFPSEKAFIDEIASFGERFSAKLFSEGLKILGITARPVDSKDVLFVKGEFGNAEVEFKKSAQGVDVLYRMLRRGIVPVVTGYYGNLNGFRATFGRGGSDYSATSIASLVNAKAVLIMSDVEGIYTADPKLVPPARLIHYISYKEAKTAAKLGMKVLHPRAIDPVEGKIPVILGKTRDLKFGTLISHESQGIPIVTHKLLENHAEISVVSVKTNIPLPYEVYEEGDLYFKIKTSKDQFLEVLRDVHRRVVENENLHSSHDGELWTWV
ncbi:TPA: aspartate kinase [Pyrococcus horikoshii]|uniref:Aspartokinase n=2 Tax=Pyrococcus horikoshii TaxID=53953 RepID=O58588_PYRHO|nr:359aa long hypothetical protein [Pyrococcus horikoshii OT3]HII61286.1 aspartate kinase [Pyrococcus horikoshii]